MSDPNWSDRVDALRHDADFMAILGRCLDVQGHLEDWRATGEASHSLLASDALDQARGMLEHLVAGGASEMLDRVNAMCDSLPAPWE